MKRLMTQKELMQKHEYITTVDTMGRPKLVTKRGLHEIHPSMMEYLGSSKPNRFSWDKRLYVENKIDLTEIYKEF